MAAMSDHNTPIQSILMRLSRRQSLALAYLTLFVVLGGGAYSAAATLSAASDSRPPRIVAAVMQDADGDARADRLRLTYSERVRHAADRDGKYPLRVAGYRIQVVGKANGKTIHLTLAEQAGADAAARPAVRYARTRAAGGRVVDRARNQAATQAFRTTRAHGNQPGTTQQPLPGPGPSPATDGDGDGTPDAEDCAPADAAIAPGAADLPDLAFVDSNCDGIDGAEKNAIFVSGAGDNTNPGTRVAPKREINAGIVAAALAGKDVYVASGDYVGIETVSGVDVYGGYLATTWERRLDVRTRIVGRPQAVLSSGDSVVLQLVTAVGLNGGPSESSYGIRAVAGANITLQRVTSIGGIGGAGVNGTAGSNGVPGGDGGRGQAGECNLETGGNGGSRGQSAAGNLGGLGGSGGLERLDRDGRPGSSGMVGTPGGAGGANGNPGKPGQRGQDGVPGVFGRSGRGAALSIDTVAQAIWRGLDGVDGLSGTAGMGGGGGGGGGGQTGTFVIDGVGNGGGGGGGGGGFGTGGQGGDAGGGSFGLYLHNANATVSLGSSIQATAGGAGGAGARGGLPGPGGDGGVGGSYCLGELGAGAAGGRGGAGGSGGGGGGGAGGPSIGVMKAGGSSATLGDVSIQVGLPGAAGAQGAHGGGGLPPVPVAPAEPGIAQPVYP
jgi:hypothetical protein